MPHYYALIAFATRAITSKKGGHALSSQVSDRSAGDQTSEQLTLTAVTGLTVGRRGRGGDDHC